MTWIRLRQIALVAHDLESVAADLTDKLGIEIAYRDPGLAKFGLHNVVMPLGTQFVEVVSPTEPGTAGGRQLERLGGDGGYMVICHTDDHPPLRRRVDELGVRVVWEATHDDGYRLLQLHPSDTGGSFLEIDYQPGGEDPMGPWHPAADNWQRVYNIDKVSAITGVELRVEDPDAVAAKWSAIADLPVVDRTISLDNATVTFAHGTGGLVAVQCTGSNPATHTIGGVEFRVIADQAGSTTQ